MGCVDERLGARGIPEKINCAVGFARSTGNVFMVARQVDAVNARLGGEIGGQLHAAADVPGSDAQCVAEATGFRGPTVQ